MGEDYDYFDSSNSQKETSREQKQQPEPERKQFGSKKLPTFEELMASEELKNKNSSNYELDDD